MLVTFLNLHEAEADQMRDCGLVPCGVGNKALAGDVIVKRFCDAMISWISWHSRSVLLCRSV